MTKAEKLLEEYQAIQNNIKRIRLELDSAEADWKGEYERALRCSSFSSTIGKPLYDDTGHSGDPVGNHVVRICELFASRLTNIRMRLEMEMAKERQIQQTIQRADLNKEESEYIRLRFDEGLKVWKVAKEMNYSERWAYQFGKSALDKIEKVLEL